MTGCEERNKRKVKKKKKKNVRYSAYSPYMFHKLITVCVNRPLRQQLIQRSLKKGPMPVQKVQKYRKYNTKKANLSNSERKNLNRNTFKGGSKEKGFKSLSSSRE